MGSIKSLGARDVVDDEKTSRIIYETVLTTI